MCPCRVLLGSNRTTCSKSTFARERSLKIQTLPHQTLPKLFMFPHRVGKAALVQMSCKRGRREPPCPAYQRRHERAPALCVGLACSCGAGVRNGGTARLRQVSAGKRSWVCSPAPRGHLGSCEPEASQTNRCPRFIQMPRSHVCF